MTYSDMPLIIPILATGYLLTVYLLLVLARRNSKLQATKTLHAEEMLVTPKVNTSSIG